MDAALLDTDLLSEILKQRDPIVVQKSCEYLQAHGQFSFSIFTRFEIARGYKEKRATRQLAKFNVFCRHSLVLPLTETVFERAEDLRALARRGGHPSGDADILIAATALDSGLALATGNTTHYGWIPGLVLTNWRQP
jgi:tRNA(fMet)-specific endonuclease VapC